MVLEACLLYCSLICFFLKGGKWDCGCEGASGIVVGLWLSEIVFLQCVLSNHTTIVKFYSWNIGLLSLRKPLNYWSCIISDFFFVSVNIGQIYYWKGAVRLVESNIESYLRQTYDSKSFKPKLINIYLDCYFIDKLFYKMVIHKLIAFLRKDTFLSYFLNIKKPNQIVLWRQTNNTFILYIYYLFQQFLLSFLHIGYSFFWSFFTFSNGNTISLWNML